MSQSALEITYSATGVDRAAIAEMLSAYRTDEPVHVVFIGTKPDIIKQYPVIKELERRELQVMVCHTGQHTEWAYSEGMIEEFGLTVTARLVMPHGVTLGTRVSELIVTANDLFGVAEETGHTLVPYIHGDTATSMGVGVAAYMSRVACVHVEAGIRTLTPTSEFFAHHFKAMSEDEFDWDEYARGHRLRGTYTRGSKEPYPEQFNTRVSDAATGFHAAPVELDREFLLDEGFPDDAVAVVGNTVVDACLAARQEASGSTIFDQYPQLRTGQFIRMCLHRRETTNDRARFTCYFDAIERLLRKGYSILWIRLKGTEWAIAEWGLTERLAALEAEFPDTLISTLVWPLYGDVIAALLNCALLATDSGSMQEEANVLEIPCVTLRFGTDRAESLLAGCNVLAPPLSPEFVTGVLEAAFEHREELKAPNLYGEDCAQHLVDEVLARVRAGSGLFRSEEEMLRLPGSDWDWPTQDR